MCCSLLKLTFVRGTWSCRRGGIGLFYDSTLGLFQYPKTAMIILFTLVIVVIIDYVSSKVREQLA